MSDQGPFGWLEDVWNALQCKSGEGGAWRLLLAGCCAAPAPCHTRHVSCSERWPNARVPLSLLIFLCVFVCVPARTVPSTRGIAPAVFAPRPSAPCCSYWPRLNMLPLRPRSTSSGARPDQLAPTQRASSFNRRTKVRKAWCLRPGTHQQNDSAKSRQHTLLGPRNRQALPLLLTEATP